MLTRYFLLFFIMGTVVSSLSCGQKDPPLAAAKLGQVAVSSDPPGATILLNGVATECVTPDTLEDVSVGFYTISVDLQGYHSCTGSLSVNILENQITLTEFVLLDTDIEHIVLGEDFTSTTCDPCCSSSLVLDSLTAELAGSFVVIRYHVWWPPPGDDPFYLANIEENTARNDYYSNFFAPRLFLDGSVDAGQDHTAWAALIADRARRETHIDLDLTVSATGSRGSVTASILSCSDYSDRNLYVRFVITEDEVDYEAPNGKVVFFQVMRDMLPDAVGERISLLPNVTLETSCDYTIESGWDTDKVNIVVFIQDDETREVLESIAMPLP
jgi:hypothetical protein